MKGWTDAGSDTNWEDYGGLWARRAPDGSWYVLRWTNLWDAAGEDSGLDKYECDVKRIHLGETPKREIDSALKSCGWSLREEDGKPIVVNDWEGTPVVVGDAEHFELCLVECCVGYGLGAPLESFTGSKYPLRIRAEARRYAEQCMKDDDLLEERLDRPVNAIGSTAREYGAGDIDAALQRGPFDTSKNLVRKMHGLPPGVEPTTEFGTLQPDGQLVNVRRIKRSDLRKCPFSILVPEHYRADGSCKCGWPLT
jgi:hypothetical protein